jgi:hypothetical protein
MKRFACEKLATAAVSVISKQIFEASRPLFWNCSMTNGRNLSSPRLWPDRLIEHIASRSRSSASDTNQRNAFSITQRSIVRRDVVALRGGDEVIGRDDAPRFSSRMRNSSS